MSAQAPHEGSYFRGGDVLLPNGYLELLQTLTHDLDIRLDSPIERVGWANGRAGIVIGGREFAHDHVVVTLPLGVLKVDDVVFEPPLPDAKQGAIERFGMGLLNKVALEFPEAFWDQTVDYFGYASGDRGKWAQWYDMERVTRRPIILAFHAGSIAERMEAMSDDAIIAEAMTTLTTIYG